MEAEEEEKEKEGKKGEGEKETYGLQRLNGNKDGEIHRGLGACFSDDVMQRQPGGLGRVERSGGVGLKVNMAASGPKPSL